MKKIILLAALLQASALFGYSKTDAQNGLLHMYTTIQNHHPGWFDNLNPLFKEHAKQQYKVANQALKKSCSIKKRKRTLQKFMQSFDDSHMRVYFHSTKKKTYGLQKLNNQNKAYNIITTQQYTYLSLPSFHPESQKEKKILENVIAQTKTIPKHLPLIIDLRGNKGGNSLYGEQLVKNLVGEKHFTACKHLYEENQYIEWRATPENVQHLHDVQKLYPEFSFLNLVIQGMQQAIKSGNIFYKEVDETIQEKNDKIDIPQTEWTKPVYVIVDNHCVSACLDCIDALYFANLHPILVGETTSKDSVYMDIREVQLPSKIGAFCFPIKVFRNRKRGHNQPYLPDIALNKISTYNRQRIIKVLKQHNLL